MKMEDHFKETLQRAVANEPPVLDAWDRFEGRLRRGRRLRMVAALAGAAAVITAAVVVVPQLGSSPKGLKPDVSPSGAPTGFPTDVGGPFPKNDWNVYRSAEGFEVHYPRWWIVGRFEAETEFHPYWVKGSIVGEPTIAVNFQVDPVSYDQAKANPTWPADATFFEIAPDRTLVGMVIASDPKLKERYGWITRAILFSAVTNSYNGPGEPAPDPFRHMGSFETAVPSDANTRALEAFMDARLQGEGHGAEDFLSTNAQAIYAGADTLHLYDFYKPGLVYYEYRVLKREEADANSVEFVVKILIAKADGLGNLGVPSEIFERIIIGPGPNHAGEQRDAVVRSATAQDGP